MEKISIDSNGQWKLEKSSRSLKHGDYSLSNSKYVGEGNEGTDGMVAYHSENLHAHVNKI